MSEIAYKARVAKACKEQALIDQFNGSTTLPTRFIADKNYKKRGFTGTNYPGLALWFSASQGVGSAVDGDPIAQWSDLSGNNRHAVQATSTKKPTFKSNIIGTKPAIRFDGIDDYLNTNWTPSAGNYSVYMVMIPRVIRNGYQISGMQSAGGYLYQGMYRDLSGNQYTYTTFGDGITVQSAYTFVVGTVYVRTLIGVRGGKVELSINKTQLSSVSATFNGVPTAPYLIGVNNLLSAYCQWDILELAIYSQAHTTAIQGQVESALAGKYGV